MQLGELIFHEKIHFFLSLFAGVIVSWIAWKRKKTTSGRIFIFIALGAFIGEFLLDTDHLFDFIAAFGLQFRPGDFFNGTMFDKNRKVFVPFHAWEWIPLLGIVSYLVKNRYIRYFLFALTIGLLLHLVYDQFYNHASLFGYSIIYRMIFGFNQNYFSPK